MRPATATTALSLALLVLGAHHEAFADDRFSTTWHDGRAEVSGYHLTVDRYGERRHGEAVLIFVTEGLSRTSRVKLDDVAAAGRDHVDTLKLNLVRDFQTGIYDYNTMISLFVTTAELEPLKTSFSSAEWCGHVYEDLRFDQRRIRGQVHSYFEGESGQYKLARPDGGLTEDELFVRLRGLRGAFLAPGAETTRPFLASPYVRRLLHQPAAWQEVTIRRQERPEAVTVPAGTFEAMVYELEIDDGRHGRFDIEAAWPHRLLRWRLAPDVEAVLSGSERTAYWQRARKGDETARDGLGLDPASPRPAVEGE